MTATHYNGSKGPVPIASMNPHHLASAHAKLLRERVGNERQDEIDAMAARLAEIEGEDAEDENPRVAMGDNQPPEPTTFEAVKTLSLIHISEPTRPCGTSRMPSSA